MYNKYFIIRFINCNSVFILECVGKKLHNVFIFILVTLSFGNI